jgi:hypothetical protein
VANRNEVEIYKTARLPSLGVSQPQFNLEVSDSINTLNSLISVLQLRLKELEESKLETFKYISGNLSTGRTVPNESGEVAIKSSNNTIETKVSNNVLDIMVQNNLKLNNLTLTGILDSEGTISCDDVLGKLVLFQDNPTPATNYDTDTFGSGTYIFTVRTKNTGNTQSDSDLYFVSCAYGTGSSVLIASAGGYSYISSVTFNNVSGHTHKLTIQVLAGTYRLTVYKIMLSPS